MKVGKFGVFAFTEALDRDGVTELAQGAERLGYSTLWYPEAVQYETFTLASFMLGQTETLQVGSGIANIYARDALAAAAGHNSLNRLYGGRFILGLGVSHPVLVEDLRGHEYQKPLGAMTAYLDGMDAAWAAMGDTTSEKQVVLAALGPRMLELAGARTLGTLPYNVTPEHAAMARLAVGPKGLVCAEQKICLTTDAGVARAAARDAMGPYLAMTNYTNNLQRLGFTAADFENGGSDKFLDAMVVWGTEEQIGDRLEAHISAGADQVVVQTVLPGGERGTDWHALEAFAPGN